MNYSSRSTIVSICITGLWACGTLTAATPTLSINNTLTGPRLRVQSDAGITNQIQYRTNLTQGSWSVLTNLLVAQSSYEYMDGGAQAASARFYRIAAFPTNNPPPSVMVPIPAGSFTMGDLSMPPDGFIAYELPTHTVYVSAFHLEVNPVTYELWQQVHQWATNHGYAFDSAGSGKAPNHPVYGAS